MRSVPVSHRGLLSVMKATTHPCYHPGVGVPGCWRALARLLAAIQKGSVGTTSGEASADTRTGAELGQTVGQRGCNFFCPFWARHFGN